MSRMPEFWHTYVIMYSDFMVIVELCQVLRNKAASIKLQDPIKEDQVTY